MKNVGSAMLPKELNSNLENQDQEAISSAGIDLSEKSRLASFLQKDSEISFFRSLSKDIEILSVEEAIKNFPEVKEYYGKNFKLLNREFPLDTEGGYFIRVKREKTVELPIQACLLLKTKGFKQKVHNLIIVEEGAKVYLITGCTATKSADEAFHLGISEFFVHKGGYLNFTMIHSWKEDITVRPISIAYIEEKGSFISNYISLKPVKDIQMYPTAVLAENFARASFNSLILSHPITLQDIGSRVILKAEQTQAEIISRAVSLGGKIIARGHLKAENKNIKAHLECRGLILSERGTIQAIPEMESDWRDVDMSHEAAIGKINQEEIEYLCSRGFSKQQAQSIIVRGFMDIDILELPEALRKEISLLEEKTLKLGF